MQRNCNGALKSVTRVIGAVGLLGTSACATIIDGKTQAMTIQSVPPQAQVVISNRAGTEIHNGITPVTIPLKRGAGYFSSEKYAIAVNKSGYQPVNVPLEGVVSGWYAGNVLLGGLIGLLTVDPLTGAMYQLRPEEADGATLQPPYRFDKKAGVLTVTLQQSAPVALPAAVPPSPIPATVVPAALPAIQPSAAVPVQTPAPVVAPTAAPMRTPVQTPAAVAPGSGTLISATEFRSNPKLSTPATMLPAGTRYERRGQVDNAEGSWWFITIDKDNGWIPAQMR